MFPEIIYGLDFGFNQQTGLLEIGIKDNEYYLRELIYETKLTNQDLISRMCELIKDKNAFIYADNAEPDRIEEIHRAGFFGIRAADKSVKDGLDYCKRLKFYTLESNVNLNAEVYSYKYKEDKNSGIVLDEPVKFRDHLMDCKRYACYTHCKAEKPFIIRNDPDMPTFLIGRPGML